MSFLKADVFLSSCMGRTAYSVSSQSFLSELSAFQDEMLNRLGDEDVFVSAKVDVGDVAGARALVQSGFYLVDTNLVFEMDSEIERDCRLNNCVREAGGEDEEPVRLIARNSLKSSRFHLDPLVDDAVAAHIKESWAGNFFSGNRGDSMVVAEKKGVPVGFLQLLYPGNTMIIDLIAVDEDARRLGVASGMIKYATTLRKGVERVLVGTQVSNTNAARFYETLGFRLSGAKYVFHAHGGRACA